MENLVSKEEREENRLEQLQSVISTTSERIEDEFSRTANSWLACFGSSVFVVETYLSSPKLKVLLTPERDSLAEKRIEELKEKLYDLKQKYPDKETVPPEEVRKELLAELDVLREEDEDTTRQMVV